MLAFGLMLAGFCATPLAAEFAGRGVFPFKSESGCPFPVLTGEAAECDRIALDESDTAATVDTAAHTIRFANGRKYAASTVVGDVVLHGSGRAADGIRVPLSIHVLISRSGESWSASSHAHAPVVGRFTEVRIDPYRIVANGPKAEQVLLTPAQLSKVLTDPSLAAKLAKEFVQVRDSREPGSKNGDITIGLGLGKATSWVARARLLAGPGDDRPLDQVLKQGTWSLELQALTGQIPLKVVKRELFLFGLDGRPLLKPLLERGFAKDDSLVIGAEAGRGYLAFRGQKEGFDAADSAARAFLQGGFIGLILGWQSLESHAP